MIITHYFPIDARYASHLLRRTIGTQLNAQTTAHHLAVGCLSRNAPLIHKRPHAWTIAFAQFGICTGSNALARCHLQETVVFCKEMKTRTGHFTVGWLALMSSANETATSATWIRLAIAEVYCNVYGFSVRTDLQEICARIRRIPCRKWT